MSPLRRLIWASAMVDETIMARATRSDQRFYDVIGTFALLMATAAGFGWTYKATLLLGSEPYGLAASAGVGSFAFMLMWSIERLMLGSVPAGAGPVRRAFAFFIRVPLAVFAAAVVLLPFGLKSFQNEIAAFNYDRRLRLQTANEQIIDDAYGLPAGRERLGDLDKRLADNSRRREILPAQVLALDAARQSCSEELSSTKSTAEKVINQRQNEIGMIRRRINDGEEDAASGQQRVIWRQARINEQRQLVANKEAECAATTERFNGARADFLKEVAAERRGLDDQRQAEGEILAKAVRSASEERARSVSVVDRQTSSGLAADVTGLVRLARSNPAVLGILAFYGTLLVLIELMAILAKAMRSHTYERLVYADEQRRQMEIDADLEFVRSEKMAFMAQAKAMVDAEKRFHEETRGQPFMELARVRTEFQARRLEAETIHREVEAALLAIARVGERGDAAELAQRHRPVNATTLETRSMLDHFLAQIYSVFRRRKDQNPSTA